VKVYIKVTRDKYRLPVAVADTAKELAELCGTNVNVIYSSISHGKGSFEAVEIYE